MILFLQCPNNIYCWIRNFSWCCIIHLAAHGYWFSMTLSKCVTRFHSKPIKARIIQSEQKEYEQWYIFWFYEIYMEFSSKNIKQHIIQLYLLLNSVGCNHCILEENIFQCYHIPCLPGFYTMPPAGRWTMQEEWSHLDKECLSFTWYVLRPTGSDI